MALFSILVAALAFLISFIKMTQILIKVIKKNKKYGRSVKLIYRIANYVYLLMKFVDFFYSNCNSNSAILFIQLKGGLFHTFDTVFYPTCGRTK